MRGLCCIAVLAGLGLGLVVASWAAAAAPPSCAAAGYHALARGSESVLLERVEPAGPRPDDGVLVSHRVCHRPTGRSFPLSQDPSVARVAGRFVAYTWESPEDECGYGGLDIVDARSGRTSTPAFRRCGYEHQFRPFVVKPSGALAWMEGRRVLLCRVCFGADAGTAVHRRTLARGSDVVRGSLRSTRRGIAWRQAGHWRGLRLR